MLVGVPCLAGSLCTIAFQKHVPYRVLVSPSRFTNCRFNNKTKGGPLTEKRMNQHIFFLPHPARCAGLSHIHNGCHLFVVLSRLVGTVGYQKQITRHFLEGLGGLMMVSDETRLTCCFALSLAWAAILFFRLLADRCPTSVRRLL